MGSIVNLTFHLENMIVGNPTYIQVQTNQDFTESTMPFNEYVAKIVSEVEDNAYVRFNQVPRLDNKIGSPSIEVAWIEMMKAHMFDMVPSALINATILVEAAMKDRMCRELPSEKPEVIEKQSFFDSFTKLKKQMALTRQEKQELIGFNDFERNTFIHQKTLTLLKASYPEMVNVKKIVLDTGEETTEEVALESAQMLWPVLKRRVEREILLDTLQKAVRLTNMIYFVQCKTGEK